MFDGFNSPTPTSKKGWNENDAINILIIYTLYFPILFQEKEEFVHSRLKAKGLQQRDENGEITDSTLS